MSDIQIRQKQDDGAYHKLYTKTTAAQSLLSDKTSDLLFDETNKSAEDGLQLIADNIYSNRFALIRCVDKNNNPLSGITASGMVGNPSTNAKGFVGGHLVSGNYGSITLISNYIDIQTKTVDITDYVGKLKPYIAQMDTVEEGQVTRFTSSTTVKFSNAVKSVDICCVGGGGGGGCYPGQGVGGGGGGGGNITNAFSITLSPNVEYLIEVGAGGSKEYFDTSGTTRYVAKNGGTSSALGVSGAGGGGATSGRSGFGGVSDNGGVGGDGGTGYYGGAYNGDNGSPSTTTEFNDGVTRYSGGGGGGGGKSSNSSYVANGGSGGAPYGGNGGGSGTIGEDGSGYGGGGGGAKGADFTSMVAGDGHSGLVAIRFHF